MLSLSRCSCAPIRPPVASIAVDVEAGGVTVCSGVRIGPTTLATARHCTEQGWPLSVDGAPAPVLATHANDVALLRVVPGPWTPAAPYGGQAFVRVGSWRGTRATRVRRYSPAIGLELAGECIAGESGAPVTTDDGVIAVVVRGHRGRFTCYAALLGESDAPPRTDDAGSP